jgi:hypothetical protein
MSEPEIDRLTSGIFLPMDAGAYETVFSFPMDLSEQIELLPLEPQRSIRDRIKALVDSSITIRGAVAFWALSSVSYGRDFARKIGGEGFLCVDIQRPTNIDALVDLRECEANVLLHLWRASGSTELPGTLGLPKNLMHSKIMLFDHPGGRATAWVGSHNGTNRAISGLNIETSLLVHISQKSVLYKQLRAHLTGIRDRCEMLDTTLVDYYRWLQGEQVDRKVIELEDLEGRIDTGDQFVLFLTNQIDAKQLKTVGDNVLLSFTDYRGNERFFEGEIGQAGSLSTFPSLGFPVRCYAWRQGRSIPNLKFCESVPADVVKQSVYFATLQVGRQMSKETTVYASAKKRWETSRKISLQIDETEVEQSLAVYSDRLVRLEQPVSKDAFRQLVRDANMRRQDTNRDLVTRVMIVKQTQDDYELPLE